MPNPQPALDYARAHRTDHLGSLQAFLRIPSISTLPEHKLDIQRAAEWLAEQLGRLDFQSIQILPTERHPVVFGERLTAGSAAPTILVYGHYDVQPADPLDLWETDPFDPAVREENLYARGASDMKGQVVAHLKAVESIIERAELPVNLKYIFEGEEEIGSPSLPGFVNQHKDLLAADLCLNADASILGKELPAITYGLRGLAYFELRLQGARQDLHSGTYGGVVDNPAQVLADLIAGMKDRDGRIQLPNFYDDVRPLSDEERQRLRELPQDAAWWREQAGTEQLFVEKGYTPTESGTARPTLDVNGLLSGFTGEGSKTVLPSKAMAKISTRLVPDQDPARIKASLIEYLEREVPDTMSWDLLDHSKAPPALIPIDSPAVRSAAYAFQQVWGREPMFNRMGGTVPIVALLQAEMGMDTLMLGFGLPDDNLHAPNEKLYLPNFYRGIETFIHFMFNYTN